MITTFKIFENNIEDNWYNLFVNLSDYSAYDKILHYYNLSKKLNIETHFYYYNELDYIIIDVYLSDNEYEDNYNEYDCFSEGGNLLGDKEINIELWLKTKKYNL
ncbi:hypothetical protein M0Q97_00960 [Candidatus Dojkabacteria bacterium]|jgi:hypothetical protein|nr:hypothetical protein [Candidatus Dojkabacteria bacterium]